MTNGAEGRDRCELNVRVIPNTSSDEIVGWHDGMLKVKVTTQPESGKANKAVCALLATHLQLPKHSVNVVRGATSQTKRLQVEGLDNLSRLPTRL